MPEVTWAVPGEAGGRAALDGPVGFLTPARLGLYETKRNDPAEPKVGTCGLGFMDLGDLSAPSLRAAFCAGSRGHQVFVFRLCPSVFVFCLSVFVLICVFDLFLDCLLS